MAADVAIVGFGLTPFTRHDDHTLKTLAASAIAEAIADAGLSRSDVDMAFVANAAGSIITGQVSIVGQVVLSHAGIDGIPVYNVDNACAGSSTALNLAVHAVRAGAAQRVLVVGVEKLYCADRTKTFRALNGAADVEWVRSTDTDVDRESVFIKHVYAARLERYTAGTTLEPETLALIAVKNRRHAESNPVAQYRQPINVDEVLAARVVVEPITTLMCAPIGDGASAAIVTGTAAAAHSVRPPIWIRGSALSMGAGRKGESTIRRVAETAYSEARLGPDDIDVAEVHDATAFSELLAYEELGFCAPGTGSKLVAEGATELGGRIPVNPSGGLESRGHPIAATGLAQIAELGRQLRGECGDRQVNGARIALAETAGGFVAGDSAAVAVHILGSDPE
jgi:acetyl-CoA acyltransferase